MADQTQRLEIATVKAEVGSNILYLFSNAAEGAQPIPTESGAIKNLKQVIAAIQDEAAEKISVATTIFQTAAAGLAATADGGIFLVQSSAADEIYTVWKNEAGAAVNTGKSAMSSQAIEAALAASSEAAQAAEEAADVATLRTAGFIQPSASPPVARDNGLPLEVGDRYFNTIDQAEYIYKAAGWVANESLEAIAEITARFSVDAMPGKTPQADQNGLIVDEWLPASVARQSDIQALISSIKGLSVNVKEFGAVGNGVTLDTPYVQALVNEISNTGGGVVYFPRGNFVVTGLKVPGNVFLLGAGASATFLSYAGESGAIGIEFTYKGTSYNFGGFAQLTPYNTGSFNGTGVLTPANADAFTKSQRWSFTDFAMRGVAGNANNLIIGDSASSAIQRCFIQGPYVAQNADGGQQQDTAILLRGLRGVVNVDISAYKIRGVRTGVRVSDFAEGFSLYSGEIVGSWEGAVADATPSKPGGLIFGNHFNCAYRAVRLERRRYATVSDNQYYRDVSFAEHGQGWAGVEAINCEGLKIGTVQTRIGLGFTSENIGIILKDSPDVNIQGVSDGEFSQLDKGLKVIATAPGLASGVSIERLHGETLTNWVHFDGPVNDFSLGAVTERGGLSAVPILITGTGLDKSSIKLPKTSTATPEYAQFANRNAAFTRELAMRVSSPTSKESLVAGSAAYVGAYYLSTVGAMLGDSLTIILRQIGGSNSTFNLYNGASTSSPTLMKSLAAGAAGANNFRVFRCYFNGVAWELIDDTTSLS